MFFRTCHGLALALLSLPLSAISQTYPLKTVRLIVPIAAGGSTDISARALARQLTDAWKQNVVVDNRPGATTVIGTELVAKAAPDGYTLLVTLAPFAVNPSLHAKLTYDTLTDFAAITLINTTPLVVVVNPTVPARSIKELIALARAHPGKLNFGSAGSGGSNHLAGELFNTMAGVKMVHVPYKGNAPALTDLVGGHVDLIFNGVLSALPLIKSGKLRALAITSRSRSAALPDLPTVSESGLKGFEAVAWVGLSAPANTPKQVIARINADCVRIIRGAEFSERMTRDGSIPVGNTPEQYAAFVQEEIVKWAKVVKFAGVKAD
ncbi:MAG: tripartite tricarboxylate transporter substrate binding protein [Burkholderiales bacterium]|nr:tripartite tricarboxylate transporter substrate binding protein [Burkholderiales bacterium]